MYQQKRQLDAIADDQRLPGHTAVTEAVGSSTARAKGVPSLYIDIGDCRWSCVNCNAKFWYGERLKGYSRDQQSEQLTQSIRLMLTRKPIVRNVRRRVLDECTETYGTEPVPFYHSIRARNAGSGSVRLEANMGEAASSSCE
ncbi:hypothetical protein Tco_1246826 [Tanacetum coccineum]